MGIFDMLGGRGKSAEPRPSDLAPDSSADEFASAVAASGLAIDTLDVNAAVRQVLDFYRTRRCAGCDLDADGDMLLFQWGVFDWGEGPSFQFDLTRQFTAADADGDESMSQLSLTLHFAPSDDLRALGSGNQWCTSPDGADELEAFIFGSPAYAVVAGVPPERVELQWGAV
jgi:hypothetical protein